MKYGRSDFGFLNKRRLFLPSIMAIFYMRKFLLEKVGFFFQDTLRTGTRS